MKPEPSKSLAVFSRWPFWHWSRAGRRDRFVPASGWRSRKPTASGIGQSPTPITSGSQAFCHAVDRRVLVLLSAASQSCQLPFGSMVLLGGLLIEPCPPVRRPGSCPAVVRRGANILCHKIMRLRNCRSDRGLYDSPLEQGGFELPVPSDRCVSNQGRQPFCNDDATGTSIRFEVKDTLGIGANKLRRHREQQVPDRAA